MKKLFVIVSTLLLAGSLFAESGYDIMKKADEVAEPKTSSSTATLTIHSKKGSDRIREVIMKSKDYGDVEKSVIVFTTPKDVAGIGYLTFDYEEEDKLVIDWATVWAEKGSTVKMRAKPSTLCRLYWEVPVGAQVVLMNQGKTWSEIIYAGQNGYMMNKFLRIGETVPLYSVTIKNLTKEQAEELARTYGGEIVAE